MSQSIELPVGELKTALAGLAKVIPANSFLPVLAGVRFAPDADGAVTIQASDLETSATYRFARATGRGFAPFVLRHDALNRQLKGVGTGVQITLAPGAEGQTRFSYALGNTRIERPILTQDDKEWPVLPALRQPALPLPDSFKAAFQQALECTSADSSRPVLWGACLDVSQSSGHYLVATDGRHLFSANSFACPLAESAIIPARRIFSWSGLAEDGTWSLAVEPRVKEHPGWLVLRSGHWTVITKPVEGNFPNWRSVIPEPARSKTVVRFSAEATKWLLQALPQLPGREGASQPVRPAVVDEQFIISGREVTSAEWVNVPVAGVTVTGEATEVSLNRSYFLKALRFGLHELEIEADLKPVIFRSAGRQMIVMPLGPDQHPAVSRSTPTPPPEAAAAPSPSEAQPKNPTEPEPKTMHSADHQHPKTQPATEESAFQQALQKLEELKAKTREILGQLNDTAALLKTAEKEQRATSKEVNGVRAKLRELQSVKL